MGWHFTARLEAAPFQSTSSEWSEANEPTLLSNLGS
jgi:hypothetical protein